VVLSEKSIGFLSSWFKHESLECGTFGIYGPFGLKITATGHVEVKANKGFGWINKI